MDATRTAETSARLYAGGVIVAGAGVLALRAGGPHSDQPWLLALLMVSAILMATFKVRLPIARGQATLSMSYVTDFVTLVVLGPLDAMLVAATGAAAQCVLLSRSRPTVFRTLFSAAVLVVTVQVTALAADAAGGFRANSSLLETATVTLIAATAFFLVNSWLVAVAVAQTRRAPVAMTWHREFLWTAPACLVGAAVAVVVVQSAGVYLWAAALATGPAYVTLKAYRLYTGRLEEQQRHVKQISDLHLASVEALARAIDARDQTIEHQGGNDSHIRRVQAWATALAHAAGLGPEEIEAIKVASLLHDIGKLAVPEHILSKPGRLTPKEFARMRVHPVIGAEILKAVPFPYPVASFVRSHHERWDGAGYPDGLRGESIPLGARVLAVADYFDAVASPRPYHTACPRTTAIAALEAEAGGALDPSLVALFLSILPTLDEPGALSNEAAPAVAAGNRVVPSLGLATGQTSSAPSVFENISRATQEMRALHDIAQTLGTRLTVDDTMALLTSKLNRLVPGSCWVLYLYDDVADELQGRFATGLGAEAVARMSIPAGSGPSGWTARHRTALVNARAAADFEAAAVPMPEPPVQSALSYPLVDGDALIGVLTIYHVEAHPFADVHLQVLDQVSPQAASVLQNAIAFERLRDVSLTDGLTDLPNMRSLTASLEPRLLAASDGRQSNALLMIDVDDFKSVNDRYGHHVGDLALQTVAGLIRAHVREADLCARYGGDEFVVALSGCDRIEAERRSRDLQAAVAAAVVDDGAPDTAALRVAISVGVAVFPDDGTTVRGLMTAADHRMYNDKAARRATRQVGALALAASSR
jgi:diguanylate cyclase (GGDEF)-like protein/putative nucleotidyltransferase with HDIG domain